MSHCRKFIDAPLTRREMLSRCANGFGAVALSALLAERGYDLLAGENAPAAGPDGPAGRVNPFEPHPGHFPAKAKNVIFLYMDGGPSQVDTFDPKPLLTQYNGKPYPSKIEPTQFNNVGKSLGSPWKFKPYGQCGTPVSDLFPHVAQHVDDICVVRSMVSMFSEHTFANYFLHSGSGIQGRPSMGSWVNYGLGTACRDLPGFIVLNGGLIPPGGYDNFNSGFLPATYQASVFSARGEPVANVRPTERTAGLQQNKMQLMRELDQMALKRMGDLDPLESAIANYEMAARMQTAVPNLMNLSDETAETLELYGIKDKFGNTQTYGKICLLARRLVERGVRFIELTCTSGNGDRWDQHGGLRAGHQKNALSVDRPIAGLLTDLKRRGLLDSTLVVFAGEFGRTPFAQGSDGRDHNPFGFSIWLAGGGIKGGMTYGETDEFGYRAIRDRVEIHDLHATMLHLLGIDHKRLTFRFSGRDMRLTDVKGNVVTQILA
ncbi:MAG: DUF1501 domain-containing protein [Planctomycetia bacterium]|nr:DUF1501 domain-containing protein [Planctomycetia bacterium]